MQDLELYDGDDIVEASLLRSVLIFNEIKSNPKRGDLLLKALYAFIIEGGSELTVADVMKTINTRFCLSWSENDTRTYISKIENMGLVKVNSTGLIQILDSQKLSKCYTENISEETSNFLDRIEQKLNISYSSSIPYNLDIRNIIKKALSIYFVHSGLEFVGLKNNATKEETIDAIEFINKEIKGNRKISNLLISILADVLHNPVPEDKKILEKWARAYIAMQVIGLDPVLSNFKEGKLKGKSFIFDTDVVLNCITKYSLNSKDYSIMLNKLKELGCKIYIPTDVIEEAEKHCKTALQKFSKFGKDQILNFTDEILEQEIGNVFIEDYVKMIRLYPQKEDFDFDVYIGNYYDRDEPTLFYTKLSDTFGKNNIKNKLPELIDSEKKVNELTEKILDETEHSRKGGQRRTEVNENLSGIDAVLYLTICEMNQNCEKGDFFANKAYLLSGSKKGDRGARKLGLFRENVICHPRALLSMFLENGMIHTGNVNLINLMDNPFLVYTAKQIWEEINPLIQAGAKLKYKELNRLRLDVDTKIDKILTCETPQERYEESKILANKGYFFGQDIIDATEKVEKYEEEIKSKNQIIVNQNITIKEKDRLIEKKNQEIKKYQEKQKKALDKFQKRAKHVIVSSKKRRKKR